MMRATAIPPFSLNANLGNHPMPIPRNLVALHGFEERLHVESLTAIEGSESHLFHVVLVEKALDLLYILSQKLPTSDDDALTIQLLGLRMSNGLCACIRLVTSGYYQAGVMVLRDVFETMLLVDLFKSCPMRISEWRSANERDRKRNFKIVDIRMQLDARDGCVNRRREYRYGLFSELGAHPTFRGIALTRGEDGLAIWGPFFRQDLLFAVIEDLAWVSIESAFVLGRHFDLTDAEHIAVELGFYECLSRWNERFFKVPHKAGAFDEVRQLLAELRAF